MLVRKNNTARNVVAGIAAGLCGALAMHGCRLLWEALTQHRPEDGIFGLDHEADVNSVLMLASALRLEVPGNATAEWAATALHYVYGAAAGAAYALLVDRAPVVKAGFGTSFGTAVWIAGDELPISALHISNPFERSAASHLSALGVHLVYGAVVESVRTALVRS